MIYIIYGMSGPLRRLMVECLLENNISPEQINRCIAYSSNKAQVNSVEVEYISSLEELKRSTNEDFIYESSGATVAINIKAVEDAIGHDTNHYVICNDIDVVKNLYQKFFHKTKILYLTFNDYESILDLLGKDESTEQNPHDNINNISRRQAINALERRLELSDIEDYTKIYIEESPTKISDLYDIVKSKTESFFNQDYYDWGLLLNGSRLSAKNEVAFNLDRAYAEDYSRVINCSAFRRLQGKAQIFPLEKHDYIRTRLTHAVECAAVAEDIGNKVLRALESQEFIERYGNNPICKHIPLLLKTSATLHDMGDPPFGHFGARGIQEWFRSETNQELLAKHAKVGTPVLDGKYKLDLENFDGNAQLIRLISKLSTYKLNHGLDLTIATFATVLKYPTSLKNEACSNAENIGYFEAEGDIFRDVRECVGLFGRQRHPLTYLLEAADDIAYLTSDLQDSYRKKLISLYDIKSSFRDTELDGCICVKEGVLEKFKELQELHSDNSRENEVSIIDDLHRYIRKVLISRSVDSFIRNYDDIMSGNFNSTILESDCETSYICEAIKSLLELHVYNDDTLIMSQIKSAAIINKLLETFAIAVLSINDNQDVSHDSFNGRLYNILPDNYKDICKKANSLVSEIDDSKALKMIAYYKMLLVTDFVCGMTDSYAKEIYDLIVANR